MKHIVIVLLYGVSGTGKAMIFHAHQTSLGGKAGFYKIRWLNIKKVFNQSFKGQFHYWPKWSDLWKTQKITKFIVFLHSILQNKAQFICSNVIDIKVFNNKPFTTITIPGNTGKEYYG